VGFASSWAPSSQDQEPPRNPERFTPELNPVERIWLYRRERYLSHRILADYDAVLAATCRAWNKLLAEKGRLASLTAYPYLTASGIP
jgi:hypothetical protein